MEVFCPTGFPSGTVVCNLWFQLGVLACVLAPVGVIVWYYGRFAQAVGQSNTVRRNGMQTIGTLTSYEIFTASNGVAGKIPVQLVVQVQPSGAPAYAARCVLLLTPFQLAELRVGRVLTVYYDPRQPDRVTVEL